MSSHIEIDAAALMKAAELGVEALIDSRADVVLANMKRLVPTDTTALLRSLGKETIGVGSDYRVKVGVDADFTMMTPKGPRHPDDYWEAVERGTSKAPSQPFIEPALAQAMVSR
jgi:HK97 gp10 family phage protein